MGNGGGTGYTWSGNYAEIGNQGGCWERDRRQSSFWSGRGWKHYDLPLAGQMLGLHVHNRHVCTHTYTHATITNMNCVSQRNQKAIRRHPCTQWLHTCMTTHIHTLSHNHVCTQMQTYPLTAQIQTFIDTCMYTRIETSTQPDLNTHVVMHTYLHIINLCKFTHCTCLCYTGTQT